MSCPTTVLITGANRGVGNGFLKAYLLRPNTVVIGAVRDPSSAIARALYKLPKDTSSRLVVVKIDSASETDAAAAVGELQSAHNVTSLDVVIANAAVLKAYKHLVELTVPDIEEHFRVNLIGPILLFQATLPLLRRSSKRPKFITITSSGGSIGGMEKIPYPAGSYAISKAALNYFTRKVHVEHEELIAFPICPGWADSDMGRSSAAQFGVDKPPLSIEKSVSGMMAVVDGATRETTSGKFMQYDGTTFDW